MVLAGALIVASICAFDTVRAQDETDFFYDAEFTLNQNKSRYIFDDDDDLCIEDEIQKLKIFELKDKPVSSWYALEVRINRDIEELHKNLHTLGFYNAEIQYKIKKGKKPKIYLNVDLKQRFLLKIEAKFLDQDESFNKDYLQKLEKRFSSKTASMKEIREVITDTVTFLQNNGFHKPEVITKRVFLNYEKSEAALILEINTGTKVNFGETRIEAFEGIDHKFIRNRLNWQQGELFDKQKLISSKENLENTQIFSSVKISPEDEKEANGEVPILVRLKEHKQHLIEFFVTYAGVRNMNFDKKSRINKDLKSVVAGCMWSKLNAFGGGEKLTINTEISPMKITEKRTDYAFEIKLSQPDVFVRNDYVLYDVIRRQELTNIFFKKSDKADIGYSYPVSEFLSMKIGATFENDYVDSHDIFFRDNVLEKYYKTWAIPCAFVYDRTNSLLNPTAGYKINFSAAFLRLVGLPATKNLQYYRLAFVHHVPLDQLKNNVIALSISGRKLMGSPIDNIPLDKRIYAGGMHSIRGYAYQMASEKIQDTDSVMGGKSSLEFSTEYRRKINKDWGVSTFFEGAKIFENQSKYFEIEKKRWFFSVGTGVRYYTSIGPIRVDLAFPLKRRKHTDSKMQFIMSLGQAF